MEIKMEDLRDIFEVLLRNVEKKGVDSIDLDVDYYWNIRKDQLYNPYQRPSDLDLGQLSDDWNKLGKIQQNQKEPLGYALVWLAAILRAVGEKLIL